MDEREKEVKPPKKVSTLHQLDLKKEHRNNMWNLLIERFPELFYPKGETPSIIHQRGIELSLGWYNIVDEMCQKLDKVVTDKRLTNFCLIQIKQKFSHLTVYHTCFDDVDISKIIGDAEVQASTACEICGEPAVKNDDKHYIRILCEKHLNRDSW